MNYLSFTQTLILSNNCHSAELHPPIFNARRAKVPHEDINGTSIISDQDVVRNVEFHQFIYNNSKHKRKGCSDFREILFLFILVVWSNHKSITPFKVDLINHDSNSILNILTFTRLISYEGLIKLDFTH